MSLSERVQALRRARTLVGKVRLPREPAIAGSVERLGWRTDREKAVDPTDYAAILAKVRATAATGSLSGLTLRDLRLTAVCLFEGQKCLANDPVFLRWFLHALQAQRSRISMKRLIFNYLMHFDPQHPAIRTIGAFLREATRSVETSPKWPWSEIDRQHGVFDPMEAPERLARLAFGSDDPRTQLTKAGLKGQAAASGLSVHVFLKAMELIRQTLETSPSVQTVEHAVQWSTGPDGHLCHSAHRAELANALLLPWVQRLPHGDIQTKIQTFLLDTLGDPRINSAAWRGADESAREVMVRWLAQATLDQFMKVVDRVAPKHQWEFRRAFWTAYIEKGVVGNAWVAFGSAGAQVAARIGDSTSDSVMRRFGRIGGAGADQAVLLLSIGDLIVADWSHNGRLRIWRRSNPDAPVFSLESYAASSLRNGSDFDTVHIPPDGWQAKAEAYIRRYTRIALNEFEYLPKKR